MAISTGYRHLEENEQCRIANYFRRNKFINKINSQEYKSANHTKENNRRQEIIEELESKHFLYDNIAGELAKIYKLRIIILETFKEDRGTAMAPHVTEIGGDLIDGKNTNRGGIVIINFNNGHYEMIGTDKDFYFDYEQLNKILKICRDNNPYTKENARWPQIIKSQLVELYNGEEIDINTLAGYILGQLSIKNDNDRDALMDFVTKLGNINEISEKERNKIDNILNSINMTAAPLS